MDNTRPVILAYDAVSPLGTELEGQWQRAAAGESGVGMLSRFPLREGFPVRIAGQVAEFDSSPYPFLKPRELAHAIEFDQLQPPRSKQHTEHRGK